MKEHTTTLSEQELRVKIVDLAIKSMPLPNPISVTVIGYYNREDDLKARIKEIDEYVFGKPEWLSRAVCGESRQVAEFLKNKGYKEVEEFGASPIESQMFNV